MSASVKSSHTPYPQPNRNPTPCRGSRRSYKKPLRFFCAATMGLRVSIDQSDRCSLRRMRGSMSDGRSSIVRSAAPFLQRGKMVFVEGVGWRWGLVGVCGASPVKDQKHRGFCRSHRSESIGAEAPPTRSKRFAAPAAPTKSEGIAALAAPTKAKASRLSPLLQKRRQRGYRCSHKKCQAIFMRTASPFMLTG